MTTSPTVRGPTVRGPTVRGPAVRGPKLRGRAARFAAGLVALATLVAFTASSNDYATGVAEVVPGPFPASTPDSALGAPTGQGLWMGSGETYTLGVGGSITLSFTSPIQDGPGTDLIVCENPFYVVQTTVAFIEALYVEVSTDGVQFVRFPNHYSGPAGPFPPTTGIPPHWFTGFAGVLPVSGNPVNGINPLDVVAGGGDAFDLRDLAGAPAVLSGQVDLFDIRFVRLTDVRAGPDVDDAGNHVWDCGLDDFASAEVDAVVAVNNNDNATGGRPRVELSMVGGFLAIGIEDTDGLSDVKAGLKASVDGFPVDFYALLPLFTITSHTSGSVTLVIGPIPPGVFPLAFKLSARDHAGLVGGDAVALP